MREAETAINTNLTIKTNDKEKKRFKLACMKNDVEMSEVLREYMREYTKATK